MVTVGKKNSHKEREAVSGREAVSEERDKMSCEELQMRNMQSTAEGTCTEKTKLMTFHISSLSVEDRRNAHGSSTSHITGE